LDREYYQLLLRQVPAGELASTVTRRLARVVRNALTRPPAVDPHDVLWAFGTDDPHAFVDKVLTPRPSFLDVARRTSVRTALARIPGATERALERARRAKERVFEIFGKRVRFTPGRMEWARDVHSGHAFPQVPVERLALRMPGADPKVPWALGRMDQLLALGQGYWVADGAEALDFAQELVRQTREFIDENPVGVGIQWASPMEVALRAANLAHAVAMCRDAEPLRDHDWLFRVVVSLAEHQRYVARALEDWTLVPNNHLLCNLYGLWTLSVVFPELPGGPQGARVQKRLCQELLRQVHPDGSSFEGSIAYHRLVLELAAAAKVLSDLVQRPLGEEVEARLFAMFRFARRYCSERGLAPQVGDNDSGRVLPLCDRPSLSHGYLAPLGAAVLKAPQLKEEGAELPEEAAWLLGEEGARVHAGLEATPVGHGFSSQSGVHLLRSGPAVLSVSAGQAGQMGVGGHSHNDKLSFELHVGGVPVVVDPGTGSYLKDAALRDGYRSVSAHSTVQVDGLEQARLWDQRPFALVEDAVTRVTAFWPHPRRAELRASYDGYATRAGRVRVERSFLLHGYARVLTVEDWLDGPGIHEVSFRLCFRDEEARLRELTPGERERALRVAGGPRRLSEVGIEVGPVGQPLAVVVVEEGLMPELTRSRYSPGYGEEQDALRAVWGGALRFPARRAFAVLF
jgi:hypothetical protein